MKRHPASANTPVCFLSAKASARDLKYGYRLGAALYLTKPFQPERLKKNIKLLFDRTPPPRRPKRFSIEQVNERLRMEGIYHVATGGPERLAREAERREKAAAEQVEKRPSREVKEEDRSSPRWID